MPPLLRTAAVTSNPERDVSLPLTSACVAYSPNAFLVKPMLCNADMSCFNSMLLQKLMARSKHVNWCYYRHNAYTYVNMHVLHEINYMAGYCSS